LSGQTLTRNALSGGEALAFAPLIWEFLPDFVRAMASTPFWLDTTTALRLLGDGAGVASADAVVVPLAPETVDGLPRLSRGTAPEDLVHTTNTVSMVAMVARLATIGDLGIVAEIPGLDVLGAMFDRASTDELEDATSDLVRAALEAGADSVCVRTAPSGSLDRELDNVTALADFYGVTAMAVNDRSGAAGNSRCAVGVLGSDGTWPTSDRGIILTGGDVSRWWSPDDLRGVLSKRKTR
jgi:hypothetical protein